MDRWCISGHIVPRAQIVFFCQVIIVYIVVIVSIVNLSVGINDKNIWIILLSSCLGYLPPSPSLKHESVLRKPAQQHADEPGEIKHNIEIQG